MADAKTTKYPGIAAALVAFQANLPKATKDSSADTGKYSYDYASLDKLTEIIFPALTSVGLAYSAAPDLTELGFGLRARLIHESGEEIGGFYPLGNPANPAQAIGSAITYARRYALLSLTGVAPSGEDDDGASASTAQSAAPAQAPAKAAPANAVSKAREELGALIESSEFVTGEDANEALSKITGGKAPAQWTAADLTKATTEIKKLIAERSK